MNKGEIWQINLDPTIGAEIRKHRAAVIVSENAMGKLPLRVIIPVTAWKNLYSEAPWMVRLEPSRENGLRKVSAADACQIRSVSKNRFIRMLGRVSSGELELILRAAGVVLGI